MSPSITAFNPASASDHLIRKSSGSWHQYTTHERWYINSHPHRLHRRSRNHYWPDLPIYAQWLRKAIEPVCWKHKPYTRLSDNGDDSLRSVRASHTMSWGHIWRPISCCICRFVEGRGRINGGASSSCFLNLKRIPFVCMFVQEEYFP